MTTKFQERYTSEMLDQHIKLTILATKTCAEYDRRCELSEEPRRPNLVKRGFPTFTQIAKAVVDHAFEEAQCLGFEGDRHAWSRFVYDQRPPERLIKP